MTATQLALTPSEAGDEPLIRQLGYAESTISDEGMTANSCAGRSGKKWDFPARWFCRPHDTASAVAAVPTQEEETLYISSGTWSLMGTERMTIAAVQREHTT